MLGIVLLWIVVYLSGMLFCKISGEKETSQLWKHLIGFFFLICFQGAFFFGGQLLGWSFRRTSLYLTVFLIMICCMSVVVCRKELIILLGRVKKFKFRNMKYGRYWALSFWLLLGIMFAVGFKTIGIRNDAVIETVQTTLMTDTMNEYHPFTGDKLELGVIMSKKIITLPFWYGILSLWTGLDAVTCVCCLGTMISLICSLLAFGELAGLLFFRDFKKTWLLVIFMELMYLSGDYYVEAAGYRQLYYGYSGEVMVATIVIPCTLSLLYRFFGPYMRADFPVEREGIGIFALVLSLMVCIGSSLFITSIAWGICMVLIAVILFIFSVIGVRLTKIKRGKEGESL